MRLREALAVLVGLALMQMSSQLNAQPMNRNKADRLNPSSTEASDPGVGTGTEARPLIPAPDVSPGIRKDRLLMDAYYDTMHILSNNNRCSAFFGGTAASVDVFSRFISTVRRDYLPANIGARMSGDYTTMLNASTQNKYRLFDKVSLNSNGPFYQRKTFTAQQHIPDVGSFQPNSREARVLMLLHELGHLMKGGDGNWLLPDDGKDMSESTNNTRRVELICGDEIRSLNRYDADSAYVKSDSYEQTVSPTAVTSNQQ